MHLIKPEINSYLQLKKSMRCRSTRADSGCPQGTSPWTTKASPAGVCMSSLGPRPAVNGHPNARQVTWASLYIRIIVIMLNIHYMLSPIPPVFKSLSHAVSVSATARLSFIVCELTRSDSSYSRTLK